MSFKDEPDTGKINKQVALFAKLCRVFDDLPPSDQFAFVELAEQLLELSTKDREMVFYLVGRIAK